MMSREIGVAKNIKHYGDGLFGLVDKDYDNITDIIEETKLEKMPWEN